MHLILGFVMGSALVGGTWIFVETQRATSTWHPRSCPAVAAVSPPVIDRGAPVRAPVPAAPRRAKAPTTAAAHDELPPLPSLQSPDLPPLELHDAPDPPEELAEPAAGAAPRDPLRVSVLAGGGVETSLTDAVPMPRWDLRVVLEPWDHLGLEAGYAGTPSARGATTSFELEGRWYPQPRQAGRYYLHGGVGWRRFHEPRTRDVATFPAGVGYTYSVGRWLADTRFTVRPTSRRGLVTFGGSAHVGLRF